MTSPAVTLTPSNAQFPDGASSGVTLTPSPGANAFHANSFRVSAVIDRLSLHVGNQVNLKNDDFEFVNLCLSLSRGLDFAIANHQQVDRKEELPSLVKQVCQIKKDNLVLAANMILMISIKNACDLGWFSGKDSEDIKNLANEITKRFGSVPSLEADPSGSLSVVSTVMSRFYPRLKLGDVLVCFEAKSGFDSYVKDFSISKKKTPPDGKVRLFVMQTDTIEASSCIISPAKVNFLLNGKGVEGRAGPFVDTGPQLPTVVSHFLKYGSNILQAVGEFNGNYIIAIAYTSETQNPESTTLQEYEHHAPTNTEPDSELIEGPSRISLNCPISFKRIKTPVKGHSCKHTQCFDFNNYVDINSRRPSWRCPHCNQHVCFTDIRIDQKMVQVLKGTKENITEVIISSDWSWKPVMESDNATQKSADKIINDGDDKSTKSPDILLDLTQTDDIINMDEAEDRKHPHATVLTQSTTEAPGFDDPLLVSPNNVTPSNGHVVDDFWSGVYLSTFEQGNNAIVVTHPPALPIGQHHSSQNGATVSASTSQNETSASIDPPLVPHNQFGNSTVTDENGRFRHITRVPNAAQALPVQTPTSVPRRQATAIASMGPSSTTPCPSPLGLSLTLSEVLHPTQQNRSHPPLRPPPQNMMQHGQIPQVYRPPYNNVPSMQSPDTSPHHHHRTGLSQGRSIRPRVSTTTTPHADTANRTMHAGPPPRPNPSYQTNPNIYNHNIPDVRNPNIYNVPGSGTPSPRDNVGISPQPFSTMNNGQSTEQNWQPAGRMRGALSGQAYADALYQFITRPSQQAQAVRPVSNVVNTSSAGPNHPDSRPMHGGGFRH